MGGRLSGLRASRTGVGGCYGECLGRVFLCVSCRWAEALYGGVAVRSGEGSIYMGRDAVL